MSSIVEAVRPGFLGRRGAAQGRRIINNSGRRIIKNSGRRTLYMQVINGSLKIQKRPFDPDFWGGAGRRGAAQGGAGRRRAAQGGAGRRRAAQGGAGRRRAAQGGAGRRRGGASLYMQVIKGGASLYMQVIKGGRTNEGA